jgi:hypothetical protein
MTPAGEGRGRVTLQRLWIAGLAAYCLFSLIAYYQWGPFAHLERETAALEAWERRLRPVRNSLPMQRGVIGYISQWDVPGSDYAVWDQEGEFRLTQYFLAPLILVRGAHAEWNLVLLNEQAFDDWQRANPGEYEIIRLRNGVYLLHVPGQQ